MSPRPPGERAALAGVAARELVATVRTGLWPIALLHPLPAPHPRATPGLRPVVLVHGFLGHPECLRNIARRLLRAGAPAVVRVGYPSTRRTLEEIAEAVAEVARPLAAEGPIDLVGHSLGAVACRAWLKTGDGARHVRRFVSLGGPHAGTLWWRATPPWLHEALRPDGAWVQRLAAGPEPVPTTVIRARYDQQVFPPQRASIPGVREVVLTGLGHNGLLWSREAQEAVVAALSAPD